MRADIHDGQEPTLQQKAVYIDARPLSANLIGVPPIIEDAGSSQPKARPGQAMAARNLKIGPAIRCTGCRPKCKATRCRRTEGQPRPGAPSRPLDAKWLAALIRSLFQTVPRRELYRSYRDPRTRKAIRAGLHPSVYPRIASRPHRVCGASRYSILAQWLRQLRRVGSRASSCVSRLMSAHRLGSSS